MESSNVETWKDIPGYEGLYQVSDFGRVKSLSKEVHDTTGSYKRIRKYGERILKGSTSNKYGHLKVSLYKDKSRKEFLVHRLVLITFVGEPLSDQEALHKDGNPSNNYLYNLRWGTSKENSEDCISHGTIARGMKLPQTKLTEEEVISILNDDRTSPKIAEDYNVSARHIRHIKAKKKWGYIKGDMNESN